MGLRVLRLELRGFRNFDDRAIGLSEGMTVLLGPNARGKTNAVEALQLLTAGVSFRNPTPAQLVGEGRDAARAAARLEGDGRVVDVTLDVAPGRKSFRVNGKRVQAQDVPRTLMSVLFTPDDLAMVKGAASVRRAELDGFGRQASEGYARVLAGYGRAVEQRNRLLRDEPCDPLLLDALDEQVARAGAALLNGRLRLFARLRPKVEETYASLAGGERLECSYVCSLGEGFEGRGKDELRDALRAALAAAREESLRRRLTPVGPHRDDVAFFVQGREARAFGSQGQQRTAALAVKMAEVMVSEQTVGQPPLLLLDDVMSELDASRREAVAAFAGRGVQTVITTTNLGYFTPELVGEAEVVRFGE